MKSTVIEQLAADQAARLRPLLAPVLAQHAAIARQVTESVVPRLQDFLELTRPALLESQQVARSAAGLHAQSLTKFAAQVSAVVVPAAVLPRIELSATVRQLLGDTDWAALIRRLRVPSNWPEEFEERLPALAEIVNADGIPVAWVPRLETLEELLAAPTAADRSRVLLDRRKEILDDCIHALADLDDELVAPYLSVARETLSTCRDGRWEVAAIAAVVLSHAVVESLQWVTDGKRARKYHSLRMDHPQTGLLERATRAPLVLFYEQWNPKSGHPRPTHLTRHVMSHHFSADQVSDRNCIVAVMLMTSLLVSVAELQLGRDIMAL